MARIPTGNEPGSTPIQDQQQVSVQAANMVNQTILGGTSRIANTLIGEARNRIKQAEAGTKAEILKESTLKEQQRLIQAEQEVRQFSDLLFKKAAEDAQKTGDSQDNVAIKKTIKEFAEQKLSALLRDESKLSYANTVNKYIDIAGNRVDQINFDVEQQEIEDTIVNAERLASQNITRIDRLPTRDDYDTAITEMSNTYSALGYKGKALERLLDPHKRTFANTFIKYIGTVGTNNITPESIREFGGKAISPMAEALKKSIQETQLPVDIEVKAKLLDQIDNKTQLAVKDYSELKQKQFILNKTLSGQTNPNHKDTKKVINADFLEFTQDLGLPVDIATDTLPRDLGGEQVRELLNIYMIKNPGIRTMPEAVNNYIKDKLFNPQTEEDIRNGLLLHENIALPAPTSDRKLGALNNRIKQSYLNNLSDSEILEMETINKEFKRTRNSQKAIEAVNNLKIDSTRAKRAAEAFRRQGEDKLSLITDAFDEGAMTGLKIMDWEDSNPSAANTLLEEFDAIFKNQYAMTEDVELATKATLLSMKKNFTKVETDFGEKYVRNSTVDISAYSLEEEAVKALERALPLEEIQQIFNINELNQIGYDTGSGFFGKLSSGIVTLFDDMPIDIVQNDPFQDLENPLSRVRYLEFKVINSETGQPITDQSGQIVTFKIGGDKSLEQLWKEADVIRRIDD